MTREDLLEMACKTFLNTARDVVVAQERYDYWTQFGTDSATSRRAEAKRDRMIDLLGHAEMMARYALKGNVTLFLEASQWYRDAARSAPKVQGENK